MSPSWAVWWLPLCLYFCLYRWTWYLQAFGNCSQGWTRLVEVYNLFSEVLANFFWFSHDVKKRGTEFEGRPWNTSRYTSNWIKLCQLAYQTLLKTWHHFLEFSKLFKGTVNLVYVNIWPTGIVIVSYKWNNLSVNNCWKNDLCHAQSRCPKRLDKTIVC